MSTGASGVDELSSVEAAIAALEGQRGVLGDAVVDTALAPLLDKRDRLRAVGVGEQRKMVTVLFGDLVDFTGVSRRLDAEDVRRIMNRYFSAWRGAIEAEGGVVEKFIGDAVMAVFGVRRAREDDAHRAVRAALAMRAALEDLSREVEAEHGLPIAMRVGIDTGEVVVSTLGDRAGEEFVVVGEPANRAARLQAAAPAGGILLSSDTCLHVRGSFGLTRLEGLRLKGIAEPVDAYLVVSGLVGEFWPETRGVEGVATRTVGREGELGRLRRLHADVVQERRWRVVTVVGDVGVGKSRLVHDLEDWLAALPDEVWALRGRASPTTEDLPNGLLRSVFAQSLQIHDTDAPATVRSKWHGTADLLGGGDAGRRSADVLATWLGFAIGDEPDVAALRNDPEALRRRAGRLVLQLLGTLGDRAPVVVLLEDLHWADSASLDWLEEVGAASPALPVLMVTTTRPTLFEYRPGWGEGLELFTSLRLEPLSRRQSRQLLSEILQRADDVPGELVETVVDVAEGNPFFIEELVKWLIECRVIQTSSARWKVARNAMLGVTLPSTLRGVLQARLDSLDRDERAVLDRASVVGRVFWDEAVRRLGGDGSAVSPELERLRGREVVFQRPRSAFQGTREFSFRHALLRDVAYESVLRSARRGYHALAARWLEDVIRQSGRPGEHAAAIAHHHEAAGNTAAAATWLLAAGRHAASTFAGNDALRLLGRARQLAPTEDVGFLADVVLAREEVLDRLGRRVEQRAALDELAAMTGLDDARRSQVRLAEGRWLFFHGQYAAAPAVADEAADLARAAGRHDLELAALVLSGRSLAFGSEHERARRQLQRALEQARALGNHRQAAESLRLLGVVATNLGENERVLELLDEARAEHRTISDVEGEALVQGQLGAVLINMKRLEEARTASEEALATFVSTGHRFRQGLVLGNLATVAMEQGRLDDALQHAAATLRLTEEIDDPEGIVSTLSRLGDAYRLTGNRDAARRHLQRSVDEGRRHESPYFTAAALSSLVSLDLSEGRVDEALDHAAQAREAARLADIPHMEARAVLAAGLASRAAGVPAAVNLLREAADRHAALGMDDDRLECLSALAVALLRTGDLTAAADVVEEVLRGLRAGLAPGTLEPGRVLVDCSEVLAATADPRRSDVAELASSYLEEQSHRIRDDALRTGFLSTPVSVDLARIAALTN